MAEYSTSHRAWKCLKNALGLRVRGVNAFYVSYGFAFLFHGFFGYGTTFQIFILGVKIASKKL